MIERVMIFDTETTGKPKNYKAHVTDIDNWPRVIQLAWTVCDMTSKELSWGDELIYPDGWEMPTEEFWVTHGFSQKQNLEEGKPIAKVVDMFLADLQSADVLVSHNMEFDYNVLGAEMIRLGVSSPNKPLKICTKEASTNYCKIPFSEKQRRYPGSRQNFKWPKLDELHKFLFGIDFKNAHDASGDVYALRACFFELVRRRVINLPDKKPTA